tara:strand:+ start:449 stop:799 length:351 start_codon:yes stop_codon:yes gene_type:complete
MNLNHEKKHKTVTYFAEQDFNFEIPIEAILDCPRQGSCDESVEFWFSKIDFSHISDSDLATELSREGTDWDLSDREENEKRITWIASIRLREEWKDAVNDDGLHDRIFDFIRDFIL